MFRPTQGRKPRAALLPKSPEKCLPVSVTCRTVRATTPSGVLQGFVWGIRCRPGRKSPLGRSSGPPRAGNAGLPFYQSPLKSAGGRVLRVVRSVTPVVEEFWRGGRVPPDPRSYSIIPCTIIQGCSVGDPVLGVGPEVPGPGRSPGPSSPSTESTLERCTRCAACRTVRASTPGRVLQGRGWVTR